MKKIINHLSRDPVMSDIINTFGEVELNVAHRDLYTTLVRSIIGQQLSTKAAASIHKRFMTLLKNKDPMYPQEIMDLDTEIVRRKAGISYAKIRYIKALSDAVLEKQIDFDTISEQSDENIIRELIQVKGIGVWTAEMFLIGALGREDVFSVRDLGLRNAVALHYKIDKTDHDAIEKISVKWSPYRSYASLYLWKSLDNTPT